MYKSCSVCGRIHDDSIVCRHKRAPRDEEEAKLRATNKWKRKSLEIRERANYLCEVCRAEGAYIYKGLQVHHITKIKEDKTLLLDNYNLICLCEYHHKQAEQGKIDESYLRELARHREDQ